MESDTLAKAATLNQAGLWRRMPGLLPETQLSPLVTQCAPWWQGAQARAPALRVALPTGAKREELGAYWLQGEERRLGGRRAEPRF